MARQKTATRKDNEPLDDNSEAFEGKDATKHEIQKLLAKGRESGQLTYDEVNKALSDQLLANTNKKMIIFEMSRRKIEHIAIDSGYTLG